jgi:hypothetical protein
MNVVVAVDNPQTQLDRLEREANVPTAWEQVLDRQESFIEELMGG